MGFLPRALVFGLLLAAAPAAATAEGRAGAAAEASAADAALSRASERRDLDAFLALVAEDAVFGGARGLVRGKAGVAQAWQPMFAADGPRLTWTPETGAAAGSADLAYTSGRYRLEAAGKPPAVGRYVTVWKKAGGAWRALFDLEHRPAVALGAGVLRTAESVARSAAGDLVAEVGTWLQERGGAPARTGLYLVVRVEQDGRWSTAVDTAVAR